MEIRRLVSWLCRNFPGEAQKHRPLDESLKSAIEQVRTAREALQSALLANPENTADIQAKATSLGNAESAVTVQRALQEAKINEVLTPASRKERQQRRRPGPRNQGQVPNQD